MKKLIIILAVFLIIPVSGYCGSLAGQFLQILGEAGAGGSRAYQDDKDDRNDEVIKEMRRIERDRQHDERVREINRWNEDRQREIDEMWEDSRENLRQNRIDRKYRNK